VADPVTGTAGRTKPAAQARAPEARRGAVRLGATVAVVLLALLLAVATGGKDRPVVIQAIVTGVLFGGVYGLVSMGLTLIFGVLDIVNFAHGALMTVAMYGTFVLVSSLGLDPYLAAVIAIPLLFVLGAVIQAGLINRVMGQPLQNQLLLTLGLGLLIENILLLAFSGTPKSIKVSYGQHALRVAGAVAELPRVIAFLAALTLAGALFFLLRRTRLGTAIRAVAANGEGAGLVGIDVRRIYVLTFALGCACVGAAGGLVLPFLSLDPTTGQEFNIIAFVVVVLGGLGNVVGALVGGLLIGLVEQLGSVYFPGQSSLWLVFIVFVGVLFLRPQGLFGRTE